MILIASPRSPARQVTLWYAYHRTIANLTQLNLCEVMQKAFVAFANTTFKMKGLEPLLWKRIQQVIAEKWKNFVSHVVDEEEMMRKKFTSSTILSIVSDP